MWKRKGELWWWWWWFFGARAAAQQQRKAGRSLGEMTPKWKERAMDEMDDGLGAEGTDGCGTSTRYMYTGIGWTAADVLGR
jgi:hypothetical protein